METYTVTVTGTWKGLYDVKAKSEEDALKQARDLAAMDVFQHTFNCPFDITFDNFDSYIS